MSWYNTARSWELERWPPRQRRQAQGASREARAGGAPRALRNADPSRVEDRIPRMRALYVILPILGILVLAYRYYSAFIAARVLVLDDTRVTPAHTPQRRPQLHPDDRWVLFGHHFAAITGAGPLVGPVLAAQFGYAPGLHLARRGVCSRGAVHDFDGPRGRRCAAAAARSPRSRAPRSARSRARPPRSRSCSS